MTTDEQWVARAVAGVQSAPPVTFMHYVNVLDGIAYATDGKRMHSIETKRPDGQYSRLWVRVDAAILAPLPSRSLKELFNPLDHPIRRSMSWLPACKIDGKVYKVFFDTDAREYFAFPAWQINAAGVCSGSWWFQGNVGGVCFFTKKASFKKVAIMPVRDDCLPPEVRNNGN